MSKSYKKTRIGDNKPRKPKIIRKKNRKRVKDTIKQRNYDDLEYLDLEND